jgi:hypothetical protein
MAPFRLIAEVEEACCNHAKPKGGRKSVATKRSRAEQVTIRNKKFVFTKRVLHPVRLLLSFEYQQYNPQ